MYSKYALDVDEWYLDSQGEVQNGGAGFGPNITSVNAFDQWITSAANSDLGFFWAGIGAVCKGVTPSNTPIRYINSFMCSRAVILDSTPQAGTTVPGSCALNSDIANPPPPLCFSSCDAFANDYLALLGNSQLCPGVTTAILSNIRTSATNVCRSFSDGYYSLVNNCTLGTTKDQTSCGFGPTRLDQARDYCSKNQNADPCCALLPVSTTSTTQSQTTSPTVSTSPTNTGNNSGSGSSSSVSPALLGGITGGIVVVVIAVVLILYSLKRQKKKQKEAVEKAATKAQLDRIESVMATGAGAGGTMNGTLASGLTMVHPPPPLGPWGLDQNNMVPPPGSEYNGSHHVPSIGGGIPMYSAVGGAIVPGASGTVSGSSATGASLSETTFATVWRVVNSYEPVMDDEVRLIIGDEVVLETIYNDGWARGTNNSTMVFGYLPMACLSPVHNATSSNPTSAASPGLNDIHSQSHLTMTNRSRHESTQPALSAPSANGGIAPSSQHQHRDSLLSNGQSTTVNTMGGNNIGMLMGGELVHNGGGAGGAAGGVGGFSSPLGSLARSGSPISRHDSMLSSNPTEFRRV
ncbi:hypothetical protein HDU76_007957 [Blyttiomyces sp. JEL0837]|nr:hypothetical protein HDU76_007957 [Blyttiomyces sp. JEL0837]